MSRRFLHLLVKKPNQWGNFALRRIDMSRFFPPRKPTGGGDGSAAADRPRLAAAAAAAAAMVDAQLPRAGEAIYKPKGSGWGRCGATILGGGKDKVVGEDGERRSFLLILYKCGAHAVRLLPGMRAPKRSPIAFNVGDGVYVMEAAPPVSPQMRGTEHCFEALVHGLPQGSATAIEDWHWRSLPAPPYVLDPGDDGPASVAAHAVVGDSEIWVSTERHGTFSFDTASGAWSKAGDWALPFRGRAEHVPEHNLWFGFSPHHDGHLCASDLTATPPSLRCTWRYRASPPPPPHKGCSSPVASYLVPLGVGRLCVTELFETTRVEVGGRPLDANKKAASKTTTRRWGFNAAAAEEEEEMEVKERFAVVTGVEVEASASGKTLRMAVRGVRRYVLSTETFVTHEGKRRRRSRQRGRPKNDDDETLHWVF
uniref:DUF295 domain-containing protein n=1 Tax=Oryza punctata TaxID=4537 RepID=A0A0E0JVE2_ORYPU